MTGTTHEQPAVSQAYEPPMLFELGSVSVRTLHGIQGCYWGKEFGGSDGFTFMGINVPISNCSS